MQRYQGNPVVGPSDVKPSRRDLKVVCAFNAAAIELTGGDLKVGDTIYIKGHTSDFEQKVDSLHIDNAPVEKAAKGQGIGVKVKEHVRVNDVVYKILE